MSLDAPDPVTSEEKSGHTELDANVVALRFAGMGWVDFETMASQLRWQKSKLSCVLRWMKKESQVHVVETRLFRNEARVRVTIVAMDKKQPRQLSSELVGPLARLYVQLKHGERSRQKLASDVKAIAARIAPHLGDGEFQLEYKKAASKLQRFSESEHLENYIGQNYIGRETERVEGAHSEKQVTEMTDARAAPRLQPYDHRKLARLVLAGIVLCIATVVTMFFASTLLRAINLISHYIDRLTNQASM